MPTPILSSNPLVAVLMLAMDKYYRQMIFRHPTPIDVIRDEWHSRVIKIERQI